MLFDLFLNMGFREKLKAELSFSGILVKELASMTGIKKHTLDNYLSVRGRMPAADIAVRIARELGVSVEYLVMDDENGGASGQPPEIRHAVRVMEKLKPEYQKMALLFLETMRKFEDSQPVSGK